MSRISAQHSAPSDGPRAASWPNRKPVHSAGTSVASSKHVRGTAGASGCAGMTTTGTGVKGGGNAGGGDARAGVGGGGDGLIGVGVSCGSSHLVRLTIPDVHFTSAPRRHAGTGWLFSKSGDIHFSQHSLCLYWYSPPSPHPSSEPQYTNALHFCENCSHAAQHSSTESFKKSVPSATGSPL